MARLPLLPLAVAVGSVAAFVHAACWISGAGVPRPVTWNLRHSRVCRQVPLLQALPNNVFLTATV